MHQILHKCIKKKGHKIIIYMANGDVKVHFCIVIRLCIQVAIQVQLLVCTTQIIVGILFGEYAFD